VPTTSAPTPPNSTAGSTGPSPTRNDAYVDQLARRIVTFDATALATTKQLLGKRLAPPTEADFKESFDTILKLASSDASKAIIARLQAKAGGSFVPKELDLPQVYGHPDEA